MFIESELTPSEALDSVTSRSGNGVYASADTLFKGAVFGRDSLEVAEDLIDTRPELVGRIILTLAGLQGRESNDENEEEVGKIVHEFRTTVVDGQPLDDTSQLIFEELAARWGGNGNRMAYYGSIDATPHFIRVIDRFCERHGTDILHETVELSDGKIVNVADTLQAATLWLTDKLDTSSSGMLEYQRRNQYGIENQVWKDSKEFYVHTNGQYADHTQPIASIEVQGLAYDALIAASNHADEVRAMELRARAYLLRDTTIGRLWQPEKEYFALGIDHDDNGQVRIIETETANPAALLDTAFFDDLPLADRHTYVQAIARTVTGPDFLTDAGVRSRSLSQANLIPFWDYHGSYVTWPKETYDIAKGLRRQQMNGLAVQLENRLVNAVKKSRGFPEFIYVDAHNNVLLGRPEGRQHADIIMVDSTNTPEAIQAWTVSAVIGILTSRAELAAAGLHETVSDVEKDIIGMVKHIPLHYDDEQLAELYPYRPYTLVKEKSLKSSNFLHQKLSTVA